MPNPRLSDALAGEAASAYEAYGRNKAAAARSLGLAVNTFKLRLKHAAERGMLLDHLPAMPGFRISQVTTDPSGGQFIQQKPEPGEVFKVPVGHVIKGVSAYVDEDHRWRGGWLKTKEGELDPLHICEVIKGAFADYEPAAPVSPAPLAPSADLLTLYPLADWHIGMFGWHREVENNWDLQIAERTIGAAIEDVITRSPSSAHAVVLGGGDLIHSDNNENKTTRGTPQQVDGRYDKVINVASRLVARTVDAALRRHEHVTVRILKGNHDKHASVAVAYFLLGWYRNEPRVTVDVSPSLFWWHRFGRVLLGATHGDEVKIKEMPSIMAHRRAEDWGATKFRYVHGFHLHHKEKIATEGEGVICEIHQAPIPLDAWSYGCGFLSGRSVKSITYHRDCGYRGEVCEMILDGGDQ